MNPSATDETDREFPCRRQPPLRVWLWLMLFACLPFFYFAMWLDQRSTVSLTAAVLFSVVVFSQYLAIRTRYSAPLRIGRFQAGFRNHTRFNFGEVSAIEETMDHMDIRARGLFGTSKTRLVRHSFRPADWDEITGLLIDRTLGWNPNAKITRAADRVDTAPSDP